MTDPWPKDYGRPALRKSLVGYDMRPAMPCYVEIRMRWRYSGIAHYADAMVDGKPVPMFRNEERDESTDWQTFSLDMLAAFKGAWRVN